MAQLKGRHQRKLIQAQKNDCPPHTLHRSLQHYICDAIGAENVEIGPKF